MVNLHQYYKEEKWNAFFQNIVPTELEKNIKFYSALHFSDYNSYYMGEKNC